MNSCLRIPVVKKVDGTFVDSELFKDLNEHFTKQGFVNNELRNKTKQVYKFALSQEYKSKYGNYEAYKIDNNKNFPNTDINGEPLYKDVLDFFNEKNKIIQQENETLSNITATLNKSIEKLSILKSQYERLDSVISENNINEIKNIIQRLQDNKTLLGLTNLINFVESKLKESFIFLEKNFDTIDDEQLIKIKRFHNSFDEILNDLQAEIDNLKTDNKFINTLIEDTSLDDFNTIFTNDYDVNYIKTEEFKNKVKQDLIEKLNQQIKDSIIYKNKTLKIYKNKSLNIISSLLSVFNSNSKLTLNDIKNLLLTSKDISSFNRFAMSIKQASEQTLQLVSKYVLTAKENARINSLKIKKQLDNLENKLINYQKSKNVDVSNNKKLYDFMLEDINGEYTGHLVFKFNSGKFWFEYQNNILSEKKLGRKLKRKEVLQNKNWIKQNTQLDNDWVNKFNLVKESYNNGNLSYKEYKKWYKNNITIKEEIDLYGNFIEVETPKLGGEYLYPSDLYLSKKFIELNKSGNETLLEIYNEYLTIKSEQENKLPLYFIKPNQMISVRNSTYDRFVENKFNWEELKNEFGDLFRLDGRLEENEYGQQGADGQLVNYVPVHFTSKIRNNKFYTKEYLENPYNKSLDINEVSFDLIKSLQLFTYMSNEYEEVSKTTDYLEMYEDLLNEREVVETNNFGKIIINKLIKNQITPKKIKGIDSNLKYRFQKFVEMSVYGQTKDTKDSFFLSKFFDKLLQYDSFNSLTFNIFSSSSNLLNGQAIRILDTINPKYHNILDLAKAEKEYLLINTHNLLQDSLAKSPKHKINQLRQLFGIDDSIIQDRRFVKRNASKIPSILNTSVEHYLSSLSMLAILNNTKINNVSLLDNITLNENNELIFPDNFNRNDIVNLSLKIKEAIKEADGAYSKDDLSIIQQQVYGRLVFQFRKWIIPTVRKRVLFDLDKDGNVTSHFNQFSGLDEQGYYVSSYLFTKQIINNIKKLKLQFLSQSIEDFNNLSNEEKKGIYRTMSDIVFVIMLKLIADFIKAANDDDDATLSYIEYQSKRLSTELGFYIPVVGLSDVLKIVQEPVASTNSLNSISDIFNQTFGFNYTDDGFDMSFDDTYKSGKNKGDYKLLNKIKQRTPIINQIHRIKNFFE